MPPRPSPRPPVAAPASAPRPAPRPRPAPAGAAGPSPAGTSSPGISSPGISSGGISQSGISQSGISQSGITQGGIASSGVAAAPAVAARTAPRPSPRPAAPAKTPETARPAATRAVTQTLPRPDEPPLPPDYDLPPEWERPRRPRIYRRGWFWALVVVVVAAGLVTALVRKVAHDAAPVKHTVLYRVAGDAPADLSFYSGDGSSSSKGATTQLSDQRLPWTHTIVVQGDFTGFGVTATFHDLTHQGKLGCTIYLDGKLITSDHAGGPAFVGCDGSGYRSG